MNGRAIAPSNQRGRQRSSDGSLYYLYCIVEAGAEVENLLDRHAVPGLEPNEALFPIRQNDLIAAVSRVPAVAFNEESLNLLLTDLPRLAPLALGHEDAIRPLASVATALVPMSFGTVYDSPDHIAQVLVQRAAQLRGLFDRVRGRQEYTLKLYCEPAQLLAAAEVASDRLRDLEDDAKQAAPGRAYLLRKQAERVRVKEAERLRQLAVSTIGEQLAELSVAWRQDEIPSGQQGPKVMTLKAVFLIDKGASEHFLARVVDLAPVYAPWGFTLDVTGPWAPYSFVGEHSESA